MEKVNQILSNNNNNLTKKTVFSAHQPQHLRRNEHGSAEDVGQKTILVSRVAKKPTVSHIGVILIYG